VVYGLASYAVIERTHEIGVRVNLGASRADVLRLILRQGLSLAMVGLASGALLAMAVSVGLERALFGIQKVRNWTPPRSGLRSGRPALGSITCVPRGCKRRLAVA